MHTRLALSLLVLIATACGRVDADRTQVLVSAAASLTDAFAAIEEAYEEANPDVDVVLNLAASSTLREQILEGAPADIFASANAANMDQLVAAGLIAGEPRVFARNLLQIVVPAGNPAEITGLADFADERLLIGLCAEGAPCGDLARRVLAAAGIIPAVDSNEPDVRALLTKIEAGELDAGIAYVTDVGAAGSAVEGIVIPDDANVVASYPIAVLAGSSHQDEAADLIEFVLSRPGQLILARYGFASP